MEGVVVAVCISERKGTSKRNVGKAILRENYGIVGDAHAGTERQVSLLALESIEKLRKEGYDIKYGDMAENIVTQGIDLVSLPLHAKLVVGETVLEIIQKGKKCHVECNVYRRIGRCIMSKEGIFAKVIKGGKIKVGDRIKVVSE